MIKTAIQNRRPAREVTPGLPLPDDAFRSEAQLVAAIQSLFDSGSSGQWAWLKELSSPSGIADLVAVALAKDWHHNQSLANVPGRWLYPLARLPLGSLVTVKSFASDFGVSEGTAADVIAAYTKASYCEFLPDARVWIKRRNPRPVAERIVAIEAKLRNWRRALYQAVQYASFASECWVVMDKHHLQATAVHIDEFERRGVGLLALSRKSEIEFLITAERQLPRLPERFWQANAEISKRLFHLK